MYVGEVGPQARGELMSYATALFCPTIYIEPFGSVAAEAQLCGTPVLCTDWGAMTETVEHGHTGFRCRNLSEFIQGMNDVKHLHRHYIRERAVGLWSLENVAKKYDTHFKRLMTLWTEGWYQEAA
jgi:glycosyltransferase involved in cell wall biosynthesis